MTFLQRLGYYLGGFSIGLIFLAFFLTGKKTSCDYGPNARVKKNIRLKTLKFSEKASQQMTSSGMDSLMINQLLIKGKVNFSESDTSQDSCKIYVIEGENKGSYLKLQIENCDSIATVKDISTKKAQ